MSVWNPANIKITQSGLNALAFVQSGVGSLNITRIVTGAGRVDSALLASQVAVSDIKQELTLTGKTVVDNGSSLKLRLQNMGLIASYALNQIGVYIQHQNMGEVLYMIAQCDEPADVVPLPSATPITQYFDFYLLHSGVTSGQVEISVPLTGGVSAEDFEALTLEVSRKAPLNLSPTGYQLTPEGWTGAQAPYVQELAIQDITVNTTGVISVTSSSDAQYSAVQKAQLSKSDQQAGKVIFKCYGVKPAIAIPLNVLITGEVVGGAGMVCSFPGGSSEDYGGKTPLLKSPVANQDGFFYGDASVTPTGVTPLIYSGYFSATRVTNVEFADYAEVYSIKEGWDYGDVVILNSKEYEGTEIALTEIPCHADAYGVISREWAFLIGGEVDATHAPVALMGKVHVNVVGGCVKGDYLVTSNISGVAKAIKTKAEAPLGGIFARAMESKSTVGVAPVLCAIWRC